MNIGLDSVLSIDSFSYTFYNVTVQLNGYLFTRCLSDIVSFPVGEPQEICALCREPFETYDSEFASGYANLVCNACDERVVYREPLRRSDVGHIDDEGLILEYDDGSRVIQYPASNGVNPVYIDGKNAGDGIDSEGGSLASTSSTVTQKRSS